jgi:UDP-glucose 4-epimerase
MKSLVTGGAGFIGSTLVEKLLEQDEMVVVVDNESANTHEETYWNDDAINIIMDVNDPAMKNAITGIDRIFHLAADISIPYSIENPVGTYANNVHGLLNVLEVARKNDIENVVFSSTAAIYGLTDKVCVETDTPDPLNPYSVSKLAGEHLMKMYNDLYGIKTVSLRYFNVYGPRQSNTGQYAPVVGIFQKQKAQNSALTIVGDGEQTRDFIHVSDVAAANILVSELDVTGVYNVGTGVEYSVNQIADMISSVQRNIPPRVGEAKRSLADSSKLRSLGWEPKIKLEEWVNA